MNKKILKFAIWSVVTITVGSLVWYFVMANALVVFDLPEKKVISSLCDHEGLRQIDMYRLDGNAVTNPSIHVSVQLGCGLYKNKKEKAIFTVDHSSIGDNDVRVDLVSFDTLRITHKQGLRIFTREDKVVFGDPTLTLYVDYRQVE